MPNIPVRDLAIQKRENDLVCATFGRGFYVLDDYSVLRELSTEALDKEAHLFSTRRSWWYLPADKLGGMDGRKGFQGDSFFVADNPTYGAVFTVHFRDAFKTLKETRKEAEQQAKKENKDARVPTLQELEKERDELAPMRYLQVTDESNTFVARVELPSAKGLHRVAWDFKQAPIRGTGNRPLALPGKYQAAVFQWDGQQTKKLSESIAFTVEALVSPSLPPVNRNESLEFQKSVVTLQHQLDRLRRRLETAKNTLGEAKSIVTSSLSEPGELLGEIRQLSTEIESTEKILFGNPLLAERFIESVPAPATRVSVVLQGLLSSSHGPTKTHREQLEIARKEIDEMLPKVDPLVDQRVDALRKKLEALGFDLSPPQ